MSWKEYQKTGATGTSGTGNPGSKPLTLLIVDDEPGIVFTLKESLRDMFEIFTAANGVEALQIFRDNEVHLVLSDQRMPEMTGVELFAEIKAINPAPVRILLTGYSDINVVIRGLNEGLVWQYVTKPWGSIEELKVLLRRAAQHYLKETQNDEPDPIRGLSF